MHRRTFKMPQAEQRRGLGPPLLPFTAFALSFTQRTCFLLLSIPKRPLARTSRLTLMRAFPPAGAHA